MKNLFFCVTAALLLLSCDRDETTIPTVDTPLLPTTMTISTSDISRKMNFEYEGDKLKKISYESLGVPYAVNYEYTGDLITKVNISDLEGNTVENLQYSGGKLVATTTTTVEKSGDYTATTNLTYSYNSDGTVGFKKTYSYKRKVDTAPSSSYSSEGLYTLKNGQVVKIVEKNNTYGSTYTTIRTYDTKNGVFKNVRGFAAGALGFEEFIAASLSVTHNNYSTISNISDYSSNDSGNTFTYEYNANDYPVKITDSYKENNQTQEVTTYTVTYNK